ncbi:hypothetical protein PV05_09451 [Exophiala xenobiotica]|uniref:DUF7730 domain-containing protein n=1 Tax=Exophiala xenobiotica TaxID=348802 RepID=A0A0D2CLC9_9EURO|nr:uncharacterized protein PV05_09451 [Exophiala xenobiotica]KIW50662.1 hypothetical protein PV05_09451 [Exophiala xenobiotica]
MSSRKTRRPVQPRLPPLASIKPQPPSTTLLIRSCVRPSTVQRLQTNKPFPFFQLPGEIRNRIYDLVVPETLVIVSGNHPQKEYAKLKAQNPRPKKIKCPRYRLSGKFAGEAAPVFLLFTCRQMKHEVEEFIYARTTFCFDKFGVINKFLNRVREAGVKSIESLELTHEGYSEPRMMADREWKLRHDAQWKATLERIKEQVTGLRRLRLDLTIYDWPCRLETTERWARPLLHLAGDGLERVDVTLEHDRFHLEKCAATAKELENQMMSSKGRKMKLQEAKRRAAMEKKRREEEKKKAKKVLTIKLPLADKSGMNNVPLKKVVRGKGLEQYARAEPPVAFC